MVLPIFIKEKNVDISTIKRYKSVLKTVCIQETELQFCNMELKANEVTNKCIQYILSSDSLRQ